jgi:hypothetical protein
VKAAVLNASDRCMRNDASDSVLQLGNAAVVFERGADTVRLQVNNASLSLLPGRSVSAWKGRKNR